MNKFWQLKKNLLLWIGDVRWNGDRDGPRCWVLGVLSCECEGGNGRAPNGAIVRRRGPESRAKDAWVPAEWAASKNAKMPINSRHRHWHCRKSITKYQKHSSSSRQHRLFYLGEGKKQMQIEKVPPGLFNQQQNKFS